MIEALAAALPKGAEASALSVKDRVDTVDVLESKGGNRSAGAGALGIGGDISSVFSALGVDPAELSKEILPDVEATQLGKSLAEVNLSSESRFEGRQLPSTGGEWMGERGCSIWVPDGDGLPSKHNPEEKTWGQVKVEHGFEGIPFVDGEPDFTEVSKSSVEIRDFTIDRNANFAQADEMCAAKWTEEGRDGRLWAPDEIRQYRKENQLSWHERGDQKTMDLTPAIVHGNIPHSGGISAAKKGSGNG